MEHYFTLWTLWTDAQKIVALQSEHNICRVLSNDILQMGADKSLARPGWKQASDQTRDLFNILPTKLNTLLSLLL